VICAADQSEHADLPALLKHLKTLKITQERYFTDYAPQRDLCTGEIIPFRAPAERYLKTEFIHKNSLKKWIKENTPAARSWAIDWLHKRRIEKRLEYPPTQVELRSLMAPTIHYYEAVGGYNKICEQLGYTIRFDGNLEDRLLPAEARVIVDTREQAPLDLAAKTIKEALSYGDYTLAVPHNQGVYIERKSLNDFVGTLSDRVIGRKSGEDSNLARFSRELDRAEEAGAYVIMLIESDINDALGFNFLPQFVRRCPKRWNPKTKKTEQRYGGAMPDHVFKNMRDLLHRYHNFQALFVAGRKEAAAAVVKLLAMGDDVKRLDLQYQHEAGRLTF
jgi:hypothetical protein